MKVLFITEHGGAPSIRLRVTDCLEGYRQLGIEATVLPTRSSWSERWRAIHQAACHDVVVLLKGVGFSNLQLHLLQRANRRIVFDFDDAVLFREQKNQAPLTGRNFFKFLRTINCCTAVAAGNNFLACFAKGNGRDVSVLPTSIDVAKYKVKEHAAGAGLVIGWLGLSDGLPYLRHIQPALKELTSRHPGLKLKVVCDKPLELDGVVVENEAWRLDTEQASLASFDIGIMPLWDSVWTRGKCGYKLLQYMGVGTPVVGSRIGANVEILASGDDGLLATTQEEWVTALDHFIVNAEERRQFGLRGRALVEKHYSLDRFTGDYASLLRKVVEKPQDQLPSLCW